jgi:hypothetical protein
VLTPGDFDHPQDAHDHPDEEHRPDDVVVVESYQPDHHGDGAGEDP